MFWASPTPLRPGLVLQVPGCCYEFHLHSVGLLGEDQLIQFLWHELEASVPSGLHGYGGSPYSNPKSRHNLNASCWCHCEQVSRGIESTH